MVYVAMDQNTGGSVAVKHLEVTSMDKSEQEFLQVRSFLGSTLALLRILLAVATLSHNRLFAGRDQVDEAT